MSQIEEVSIEKFKHLVSERALTGETMLLNMGPQHPSTHGVLRLLLELDGEIIVNCIPDIGFLHTGIEKNMEAKTYQKAEVMTDRLDYMNTMGNNLAYVIAVEKLVDLDVPVRAQGLRVILTELQRIALHLVWLGTSGLDLAAMSMFLVEGLKEKVDFYAGEVSLKGRIWPFNDQPMFVELILPNGKLISATRILTFDGIETQSFETTLSYKVTEPTLARLTFRQDNPLLSVTDPELAKYVYVYSVEVTLNP